METMLSTWRIKELDAWIASFQHVDAVIVGSTIHSALLRLNRTHHLQQLPCYTVLERLRP